jgi:phosphate transport system permease protein
MTALPREQGHLPARAERGRPRSRSLRTARERFITALLVASALLSVLTTFAIIGVLLEETRRFFTMPDVSVSEFFLGGTWQPLLGAEKHFGMWPLICGTGLVTAVSALVALPLGLITAIYLSEYAPPSVREVLKPVLEILAGIPTVVYGFFALSTITPALQAIGVRVDSYNALSAGLAIGIMTLPIVCSLSEDALHAVPRSLREGAYACGGTRFDVSLRVVVPAALSGIVASYLLAIARATGETMIVALAAGGLARLTLDPRDQVQTMTGYIAQIFLGDASSAGVEYLSSYAVAFLLFAITLAITFLGQRILARYREVYQ